MALIKRDKAIKEFWQWFQKHLAQVGQVGGTRDPYWDVMLRKLQAIAKGLWFELWGFELRPREFIPTAAGHTALFPLVDRIVERAPKLKGWRVIALKPVMGFNSKLTYEGIEVDPHSLWFLALGNRNDRKTVGLRIGVPGYRIKQQRSIKHAVLLVLDTALGERVAAQEIKHVEVCNLPKSPQVEMYVPLPKLATFLEWRKRRLQKV